MSVGISEIREEDKVNVHILACIDPNAHKDDRRAVLARVPYNATSVRFLCENCKRFHIFVLDPKLRNWKNND